MSILRSILGLIILSFCVAVIYGVGCATVDFLNDRKDPVQSGRHAAATIYGLFGVVTEEAKRNDAEAPQTPTSSAVQKIATPYAVTADISALLCGKLENSLRSTTETIETKTPVQPSGHVAPAIAR